MDLATKIAPAHTALLVVDIQKDFAAPDGLLGQRGRDLSMVPGMLEANRQLIAAAEKANVLTLYAQQIFDRTKLTPLQLEQYDLDGKLITADIAGTGWHFHGITPPPEDKIFVKYNYNAFSNPNLHPTLQKHGIKTLVITGMDTHICVETAIRSGFDLGYKIVVPADAVACNGRHQDLHARTLQLTEKIYGKVTTTAEILSLWQKIESGHRFCGKKPQNGFRNKENQAGMNRGVKGVVRPPCARRASFHPHVTGSGASR